MHLISADYIMTCNGKFDILENQSIVFNENILDIGSFEELIKKYPNSNIIKKEKNSVILPGLINTHVHLEFSANKTSLYYGDFIKWLHSVMRHRDKIIKNGTKGIIDNQIQKMISSGTTSIGAISSYGLDLQSLVDSPLRVIYFNEVIGSQLESINDVFDNLKSRFNLSSKYKNNIFTPAIAIHSPYSVHPILLKDIISFIKKQNIIATAHFLESPYERKWLEEGKGKFRKFFKGFFQDVKPLMSIEEFLENISLLKHIILTHANYIRKKEFNFIKKKKFYIAHCPVSNRLLGSKKANFNYLKKLNSSIGTDGLSSNISLSIFDELREALFIHNDMPLNKLAKKLLLFATKNGSLALGLNSGEISIGKNADLLISKLPDICSKKDIALNTILHTKTVSKSFINGTLCYE